MTFPKYFIIFLIQALMLQEGSGTAKVVMEKLEKLEKEKIVEQRRKKVAVEVEAEVVRDGLWGSELIAGEKYRLQI